MRMSKNYDRALELAQMGDADLPKALQLLEKAREQEIIAPPTRSVPGICMERQILSRRIWLRRRNYFARPRRMIMPMPHTTWRCHTKKVWESGRARGRLWRFTSERLYWVTNSPFIM